MHLEMAECRVPFLGHCDLDLVKCSIFQWQLVVLFVTPQKPVFGVSDNASHKPVFLVKETRNLACSMFLYDTFQ